jgi:hypothetical protein
MRNGSEDPRPKKMIVKDEVFYQSVEKDVIGSRKY